MQQRGLFSRFTYLGVSMSNIARELDVTKSALIIISLTKQKSHVMFGEVADDIEADLMEAFKETNP
jgi:hypothetical protein